MISRVFSLAVLCLLLHIATSAYGQTDCLSLKGNVELILSIGPWQSQHLAILTTDRMLFKVKITQESLDAATVRLELSAPSSLATLEPKLNDLVHQLVHQAAAGVPFQLSPSDTLIQVKGPLERLLLLAQASQSWVINPLNGDQHPLTTGAFLSDATWLSSQSLTFYALNGSAIQGATFHLEENHIDVDATVRYWETGDGDTLKVVDQPTRDAPNWKVKKAFHWQGNFYLLTPETVYVFDEDILHSSVSVALLKIPYEQFFICPEAKEATKNGTGKETKEETSKGTVTRAHWAHPSSTVAQHVNVVAWVLGLLCLFCLFPGFVGALLYYFLIYSKKESLQGRVLSSGSVSFNGGLVHIHSKTGEPKVKMASSKGLTASQLPGGLRVPTKVNVDVAKKQAAKLALKRASTGALKGKREKSKVQSASAPKTK